MEAATERLGLTDEFLIPARRGNALRRNAEKRASVKPDFVTHQTVKFKVYRSLLLPLNAGTPVCMAPAWPALGAACHVFG
jgi:hypothetical protein